jgi:hypothetical protein
VEWISRMKTWSEFNYVCIYYGLLTCDLRLLLTVFRFLDGQITADGWAAFPPKNFLYSECNFKFVWEQLIDELNTENACYVLVKHAFIRRLRCKICVFLWSSGQSSWVHNGDVLCFMWGTNLIYICYVEECRPPLWSTERRCIVFHVRYELNVYILCRVN